LPTSWASLVKDLFLFYSVHMYVYNINNNTRQTEIEIIFKDFYELKKTP
jgi:hypothetical protein